MKPYYRVLRYSPAPELIDPVNVAIVINDGRLQIRYDESFRRLRCVAPDFNTVALKFYLQSLESDLESGASANYEAAILSSSAQLSLSSMRELELSPRGQVVQSLIDDFLLPIRTGSREKSEAKHKQIETLLGQFLTMTVNVPNEWIRRRAKPSTFLRRSRSRNLLRSSNISIKRVVDGNSGIVLIDGVNLLSPSVQHLTRRADAVAMNFYTIGKVQREIEEIEQRSVSKAAIVFGCEKRTGDSKLDYMVHQIERESDIVIDPGQPAQVSLLAGMCREAISR